jgi:uncharacterized protein
MITVTHNEQAHRFESNAGDGLAVLDYEIRGDVIYMTHTQVPSEEQGQGVAAALAKVALEFAKTANLQVVPACRFVQAYLKRHREYLDIVSPQYRSRIDSTSLAG